MKKLTFAFFIALAMIACKKKEPSPTPLPPSVYVPIKKGTYTSKELSIAGGKALSWIRFDADDVPSAMGITMYKGSFEGLPDNVTYDIALPGEAISTTPFQHIYLLKRKFNGASPYNNKATFYFGFYMNQKEDREGILKQLIQSTPPAYSLLPPAGILPADYSKDGGEFGLIGHSWYNTKSPEWNDKPFTNTLAIGTWNGNLLFYAPMVLETVLNTKPTISEVIPTTTKAGYFPNKYSIKQDGENVVIALEDFRKN